MRYLLLGKKNKRFDFFKKACDDRGISLLFYDIDEERLFEMLKDDDVVKIDPIANQEHRLSSMSGNINKYHNILQNLSEFKNLHFLNAPEDIYNTLDKKNCKELLLKNNIPTTPMLNFNGNSFEELLFFLRSHKISQVFIKPNFGSGSAGVSALKYNHKKEICILKTTMQKIDTEFVNTKKEYRLTSFFEIKEFVEYLLQNDPIIEIWLPKDTIGSLSYDLRVVYQFSKIEFIVARGSKGSITNLHLNNLAIDFDELNFSSSQIEEIEQICRSAIQIFPNLNCAGFDILIEKNSKKPYIIEINSQGDLIYQDIYNKNKIYKKQVEMMVNKWKEKF